MPLIAALWVAMSPGQLVTVVDAPVGALFTPSATSGAKALFAPTLRFTQFELSLDEALYLGWETALFGTFDDAGTDRIRSSELLLGAEFGALLGWSYGDEFSFQPFFGLGAIASAGVKTRRVDQDEISSAVARAGLLASSGIQLRLKWLSVRVDLGLGTYGLGPVGRARFALGGVF